MKKILSIKRFPGLIQEADTRDVPQASVVKNVDVVKKLGVLQPSKGYEDLGVDFSSTTIRQLIEYLNPQHNEDAKILFIRKRDTQVAFVLDLGSGYGTPDARGITKATVHMTKFGEITTYKDGKFDDISFIERNGVIYGGTGIGDDNYPFIFLLTDYKRFEDYDNTGTYFDDWSLESATNSADSYLLEQADLLPPLNDQVRLVDANITSVKSTTFDNAGYTEFGAGDYGFYFSYIYDGFQESSFKDIFEDVGITYGRNLFNSAESGMIRTFGEGLAHKHTILATHNILTINIEVAVSNIPRRVTAINIYIRKLTGTTTEKLNTSELRLVKSIPIDDKQVYSGRTDELIEFQPSGFTSRWDDQGSGWWRFIEEPRETADVIISSQDFLYASSWYKTLGYLATTKISPKYKYSHVLNNIMYVGPVSYENKSGEYEYFSNIFTWSALGGQFSVLPFTNRGIVTGEITGLNSILDSLLVFTLNDCFIFKNGAQEDVKQGIGCYSHFSIVAHSNYRYWASKKGFIKFNGYKEEKISNYFVEQSYTALTDAQKKTISGVYAPDQDQIIWTVPDTITFIYSLRDGSWATRDYGFRGLTRSVSLEVYGTDGTDVFKIGSTYTQNGSEYTSNYTLKNLDAGNSSLVKTLTMGYIQYKSLSDITVSFLYLDTVMKTITFPSTSGVRKIEQFNLGINAESIDIKITANGSSEYEIEFIDIWGDVNDVKGN